MDSQGSLIIGHKRYLMGEWEGSLLQPKGSGYGDEDHYAVAWEDDDDDDPQ